MKRKRTILVSAMILFGIALFGFEADAWRGKFRTTTYEDSDGDIAIVKECKYHLFIKECEQGEGDVVIPE